MLSVLPTSSMSVVLATRLKQRGHLTERLSTLTDGSLLSRLLKQWASWTESSLCAQPGCGATLMMEHFSCRLWFSLFFCYTYWFSPTGLAVHLVVIRGGKCVAMSPTSPWYNPAVSNISLHCFVCTKFSLHWEFVSVFRRFSSIHMNTYCKRACRYRREMESEQSSSKWQFSNIFCVL